MSDYKYWLDIDSPEKDEVSEVLSVLKTDAVAQNVLILDIFEKEPRYGKPFASLSTEGLLPDGTSKGWDAEEHEKLFHGLSKQFPGVTFEFRGVCVDDPQNEMFLKVFQNGMYKELWQDNSDMSERLAQVPWRPYGEPESEIDHNMRKVIELVCTHETRFGIDTYTSLHPSNEKALAHVDTVKEEHGFGEFGGPSWNEGEERFNYDIKEHIIDIRKFAVARQQVPERQLTPDEELREDTMHVFNQMREDPCSVARSVAEIMVEIQGYDQEWSTDVNTLYTAAVKINDCWLRDQQGFNKDEIVENFCGLTRHGSNFCWRESPEKPVNEKLYSPEQCFKTLMNAPQEVFDYFLGLEIQGHMGIMSIDKEVLQPLLDALDGKEPLEQTLAAAQSRANDQAKADAPRLDKDGPTI